MIAGGYMDIYSDTFEKLTYDLKHNANPGQWHGVLSLACFSTLTQHCTGASQIQPTAEYEGEHCCGCALCAVVTCIAT